MDDMSKSKTYVIRTVYKRLQEGDRRFSAVQNQQELIEEAWQQACVNHLSDPSAFRGECDIRTWLVQLTLNAARNMLRKEVSRLERKSNKNQHLERGERAQLLVEAADDPSLSYICDGIMNDLSELMSMVVDGMSYEDIAGELGIPVGTVRSRINRERKKLKEKYL